MINNFEILQAKKTLHQARPKERERDNIFGVEKFKHKIEESNLRTVFCCCCRLFELPGFFFFMCEDIGKGKEIKQINKKGVKKREKKLTIWKQNGKQQKTKDIH